MARPGDRAIRGTPIAKVWAYKSASIPTSNDQMHTGWPTMNQVLNTPSTYELLDSHLGSIAAGDLLSLDITDYFN